VDGVINVYKEQGMTSFDVVFHCKKIFDTRKVGHTGTLDPMATGVLPICIGKATKLVEYLTADDKVYTATLKLGLVTDTQDITGTVLEQNDTPVTEEQVRAAAQSFLGDSLQVPPMYSAIKIDGRKLVDLARKGVEVERPPRPITIYAIDFLQCREEEREYVIQVHCKKGTYIRSLCHDIGQKLGVGGVMKTLERNRSGSFGQDTARTLDELRKAKEEGKLEELLLPVDFPFRQLERIDLNPIQERMVKNGVSLALSRLSAKEGEGQVAVYGPCGDFLMLAEKLPQEDSLKMIKSFYG
jgi:tRNA pseudouridine55 synthase